MSQYVLFQDIDRCIGCYSCEVHCKANKGLPDGPRLCRIYPVGPRTVDKVPRIAFPFMACFHCETPWCVPVCPTGAMQKRPKDGIVFVDEDKCIGCRQCMYACPWGVPQWNPETRKVVKCDLCRDRIDEGLQPSCVTKCITGCLYLDNKEDMPEARRKEHDAMVSIYPESAD
ncbi:MAG: 4Fe-4S binding protein [Deltaproteobacteria bacterium]|nr:4Fe-4S binding protein [Deltaproteobacteria bacterium]